MSDETKKNIDSQDATSQTETDLDKNLDEGGDIASEELEAAAFAADEDDAFSTLISSSEDAASARTEFYGAEADLLKDLVAKTTRQANIAKICASVSIAALLITVSSPLWLPTPETSQPRPASVSDTLPQNLAEPLAAYKTEISDLMDQNLTDFAHDFNREIEDLQKQVTDLADQITALQAVETTDPSVAVIPTESAQTTEIDTATALAAEKNVRHIEQQDDVDFEKAALAAVPQTEPTVEAEAEEEAKAKAEAETQAETPPEATQDLSPEVAQLTADVAALKQQLLSANQESHQDQLSHLSQLQQEITLLQNKVARLDLTLQKTTSAQEGLQEKVTSFEAASETENSLILAITQLHRAINSGKSFTRELETIEKFIPEGQEDLLSTIQQLKPYATTGIASTQTLQEHFDPLPRTLINLAYAEKQQGFWGKTLANLRSLVTIRPTGKIEGTEVKQIVARAEFAMISHDLAQAVLELKTLPEGEVKQAATPWIHEVEAYQLASRLLDALENYSINLKLK